MTFTSGEIEGIPVNLVRTFSDMENRVMARIVETLKNNGADIARAVDWQLHRLNELGKTDKDIKESIQRALDLSDEEIDKVYSDTLQESYLRDRTLYENMGQPFIPYDENLKLKQLVSAVIQQTKKECRNITQSLGFAKKQPDGKIIYTSLGDFYRDKLDSGLMEIATGITDYNTVLNRLVSEMTNSGMRWIDYESGWSNRVDVACRRALLTGYNQIVAKVNEDNAENLGTEHFEVSYHSGARPTHQVWQGRVYTKKELETVCGLGTVTGLCGANCYHSYSPFIVGVDERTYTDEELDRMNAEDNTPKEYNGKQYTKYEALQRQRRLETTMRAERQKINRLIQGEADEDDILAAKVRYNGTSDEYVKFSRSMGLPQQRQRVTVDGLGNIGNIKKQKSVNISGAKTVAKSTESGIIKTERETSPRKNKKGDFSVDWSKIQSDEYSDKFKKLSENRRVYSSIETRAKWSLNNRDGLDTEEIYAVDLTNGDEVAKITDQHYKQGVKRTSLFTSKLNEADSKGHKILLLHNHPNSLPPSINDINVLLENKNVSGITIGHNGSIYYYTRPKTQINIIDYNVKLRHYKNLDEIECIETALFDLQEKFGYTIIKL